MNKPIALVTGAGGEMGRLLVPALVERGINVVALDLGALPPELEAQCVGTARMNILDTAGVQQLMRSHQPAFVFHLAALLSSHAERDPDLAHRVNVEANTRADGEALLQEAAEIPIRPQVTTFTLEQANEALVRLKQGDLDGTGLLLPHQSGQS